MLRRQLFVPELRRDSKLLVESCDVVVIEVLFLILESLIFNMYTYGYCSL